MTRDEFLSRWALEADGVGSAFRVDIDALLAAERAKALEEAEAAVKQKAEEHRAIVANLRDLNQFMDAQIHLGYSRVLDGEIDSAVLRIRALNR